MSTNKLLIKDGILSTIFSLVVIFILSYSFINISFLNPLETAIRDFSFLDIYYSENFYANNDLDKDIILLNVEHRNRFEIAQLVEAVKKANPKVIGLDVMFEKTQDTIVDIPLSISLNDNKLVNSFRIEKNNIITSDSLFVKSQGLNGYVNFNFNNESNIIRTFQGRKKILDKTYNSFAVEVAKKFLGKELKNFNLFNSNRIKFQGKLDAFDAFGFDDFMRLKDRSIINNRIVIIGYLGEPLGNINDIEDKHFTPLNKDVSGKRIPDMFGSIIHANIISMLINDNKMYSVSKFWLLVCSVVLLFIGNTYFIWLEEKKLVAFLVIKKLILFVFTVVLMWLIFWLFKIGIVFEGTIIIGIVLLGCSLILYYKWIIKSLQKKNKWKSYF